MKEYKRATIQESVRGVNKNIFLPDIQRPFVWEKDKIYKLFDSLMREYPIGTFLYWELSREQVEALNIKLYQFVNSNEQENTQLVSHDRDDYSLVLDGQQRLTSLYIGLKGVWIDQLRSKSITKELYFNLLSGESENEEGLKYEFSFFPKTNGESFVENDEKENPIKLWINVKKIYESDLAKREKRRPFVIEVVKKHTGIEPFSDRIENNIEDFDRVLKDNGIINYFPEDEDSYEKVLDIFVRTNSGGMKLGYSDLLFSRIKLYWDGARDEFKILVDDLNRRNFEFDTDFVLKASLLFFSQKTEDVRYSNAANLNQQFINTLRSSWPSISSAAKMMSDLLDRFLILDKKLLPSYNALIPVMYWFFKQNKSTYSMDSARDNTELALIRAWLIKALLSGVFGGQSDTTLYKCKEAIDTVSAGGNFPAVQLESKIAEMKNRSMEIREELFDKYRYRSKESHLFLSICYRFAINFQPLTNGSLPEQDHIFCRRELEDAGYSLEKINSIYNIRFVTGADNRKKSDIPFIDWINGLGDKNTVLSTHFIPIKENEEWGVKDFEDFIQKRRTLLLAALSY